MVDAGTIEMVRGAGAKVVSSADLVQKYEACWTDEQLRSHEEAGRAIDIIVRGAFQHAAKCVREGTRLTEYELKQWIQGGFDAAGLRTEEGPDVAVNAHASDPHYGPTAESAAPIRKDDLLLLDVWGKLKTPGSVYYDITWVGYLGKTSPEKIRQSFSRRRQCSRQGSGPDLLQRRRRQAFARLASR